MRASLRTLLRSAAAWRATMILTQQNQFEVNSLRNRLQQQQMFPPARTCAPGAIC